MPVRKEFTVLLLLRLARQMIFCLILLPRLPILR